MKMFYLKPMTVKMLVAIVGIMVFASDSHCSPVDTPSVVWRTQVDFSTKLAAVSFDGRRALYSNAYGEYDGPVVQIDVESGAVISSFLVNVDRHQARDRIKSMHFLNDTSFMVVTSFSFYVVDSRNGKVIEDVGYPPTPYGYDVAVPMYDTDKWIVGCHGGLFIYHYKTRRLDTIQYEAANENVGHPGHIGWIGISEDEHTVYSAGSRDFNSQRPGRVCAWELATGKQLYQVDEPDSVYLQSSSPFMHGDFMATLGVNKAVVFNLRTGTLVAQYYDVAQNTQGIGISKDGAIVGIQGSGNIEFYTTKNPHLFARMQAWPAYNIHFLNDGSSDVLVGQIDTFVVRARLNLATSVNGETTPQELQCSIAPNPSGNLAELQFVLRTPSVVSVRLSALDGRVITDHTLGFLQAGSYAEVLQASAGLYMCTVTAGAIRQSLPVMIR